VFAPNFFFPFSEDDHVAGELFARSEMGFERFDVEEQLAFVVD
jgi:hypothetical protein